MIQSVWCSNIDGDGFVQYMCIKMLKTKDYIKDHASLLKCYAMLIGKQSPTLKMEVAHSSRTSSSIYQLTCYNILEDVNLHQHCCELTQISWWLITTPNDWQQPQICILQAVKAVLLQARSGPEGSRKWRFPDFMTTAQDGGKAVSLMHQSPLPPGNAPGTHFC